jgi:NTP pyrophosphatase (non-canonical NTP hydrolase)
MKKKPYTLKELSDAISSRDAQSVYNSIATWSPTDWGCAIAGEVGELCNMLKKVRRGSKTMKELKPEIKKEIADIFLYTLLISKALDIDLEDATIKKFNEVSRKLKVKTRL